LAHGGVPQDPTRIVQQCKVGLVAIQRNGTRLAFAAPPLTRKDAVATLWQALPGALGIDPKYMLAAQHLNNGPSHFGVLLDSVETVLGLLPDLGQLQALMAQGGFTGLGVAARYDTPSPAPLIARSNREARAFSARAPAPPIAAAEAQSSDLEVRFFFDRGDGVAEDPITGSFNASLAQWLIADDQAPRTYVAAQGTCIGRDGRVYIEQDASGQVWVGGDSVTCIDGQVEL
jgi:predicted PhzF superfamily epimerase YddE/YHI9